MWLIALVALVVGGVIGVVIGSTRRIHAAPGPAGKDPMDEHPGGDTLRAAVDQLALGVVVGDADGRIVYRNVAATTLQGTHQWLLIEEQVERILAVGRSGRRLEDQIVLHGPPKITLQLFAQRMPNGFSVATIDDVSERNRIEAMRTDFVANISHELKTPVGAIAVLAEALSGEDDLTVIDRVAGRLVDEAHRAVAAIDDLLELSRIESGPRLEEDVDLADVISSAIARGRVVDETRNVVVTALDSKDPVLVRCDSRQLVSAIGNLVENAVKYSGDGGKVEVRTRCDEHWVEVVVTDQGDGIPVRDLDRIFERFYRVDRARSRETGGTGLGLSIVRHVASNHGGDILVTSTEGEGSTFVLRLPSELLVGASVDVPAHPHGSTSHPAEESQR